MFHIADTRGKGSNGAAGLAIAADAEATIRAMGRAIGGTFAHSRISAGTMAHLHRRERRAGGLAACQPLSTIMERAALRRAKTGSAGTCRVPCASARSTPPRIG